MKYKKINKYKYQLCEDITFKLPVKFGLSIEHEFITLKNKHITILKGYCWDGASGPTFDTKNTQIASIIHDALYQLIKLKLLPENRRNLADECLLYYLLEAGMSKFRAYAWYYSVRAFGHNALIMGKEPKIIEV